MTDRELLELAAKAAGYDDAKFQDMTGWGEVRYGLSCGIWSEKHLDEYWNPLESNGDALRLTVKLRLDLHYEDQPRWVGEFVEVLSQRDESGSCHCETHALGDDPYAATRRAIVRAAAEIGKDKE